MIKSELERVFRGTRGRLAAALILAMPALDLVIHLFCDVLFYGDFQSYHLDHPVYAAFLCGSAVGKMPQILFFWLLPLYFLPLYGDSVLEDARTGYGRCLQSRAGRRSCLRTKLGLSFALPAGLVLGGLLANLLLCVLLFHGGYGFGGYEDFYESMGPWFALGIRRPYLVYGIYMLSASLVCGLTGLLGACCCLLAPRRTGAYFLAFCLWLLQIILPWGVGHAVQPFVEGGFGLFLSGLGIYAATVLLTLAAALGAGRRRHELS